MNYWAVACLLRKHSWKLYIHTIQLLLNIWSPYFGFLSRLNKTLWMLYKKRIIHFWYRLNHLHEETILNIHRMCFTGVAIDPPLRYIIWHYRYRILLLKHKVMFFLLTPAKNLKVAYICQFTEKLDTNEHSDIKATVVK